MKLLSGLRVDDRDVRRDLRRISEFECESGMRVEEVPAKRAPKNSPRYKGSRIPKSVVPDVFSLARAATAWALELVVESLELLLFRSKLVRVAFDGFPDQLGVHLHKRHERSTVDRRVKESTNMFDAHLLRN